VAELRYTLLSDGSSDRMLMPLLAWALRERGVEAALTGEWADLRVLRDPPATLEGRIEAALDLYPCDLLFVHRDAEEATVEDRQDEIGIALKAAFARMEAKPAVCVVPRRMAEAWFLIDEGAIRSASGNPRGAIALTLPRVNRLEEVVDPKELLYDLLRTASEHRGRRLRSFPVKRLVHRVAELIEQFATLRALPAFAAFEDELGAVVGREGWAE